MNILICTHLWLSQKLFCHKGLILCKAIPSIACIMCPMRIGVIKTRCRLGSHLCSTRTARTRVTLVFFCDLFFFSSLRSVFVKLPHSPFIPSLSLSLLNHSPQRLLFSPMATMSQHPATQCSGLLCSTVAPASVVAAVVGSAAAGSAKRGRRRRSSVGATLVPNPSRFTAAGSRAGERAGNGDRLAVRFAL
jgi:hypothetical protein